MRARPAHERYASLPWLIVTMTVVVLTIGAIVSKSLTFSSSSVACSEKSHVRV